MKRKKTNFIVVHCSATPARSDIGAKEIREWHKARGFSDIGYQFVIRRDGWIETGRPIDDVGAHVQGHNSHSVGICMVGGLDEKGKPQNNFTPEQFKSLSTLIEKAMGLYPNAKVVGHRDLSPDKDGDGIIEPHEWLKDCPCFDVRAWLASQAPQGDARSLPLGDQA